MSWSNRSTRDQILAALLAALVFSTTLVVSATPAISAPASGTISGIVFRDFAIDGIYDTTIDAPEEGIEVRAYDDLGNVAGPTLTGTNGEYSLDLTGLEQTSNDTYRVEFTIPANASYLRNGYLGADNDGPVQFAQAGATGIDFAVHNPAQFCDNNPQLAVTCWVNGDPNSGGNAGSFDALVTLPWDGFGTTADLTQPSNPSHIAFNDQIGTTWGLAYQRETETLFVGAAQRRHSGFGPGGTGMIYRVNTDGSGYSQFLDLNAVAGISTGTDPHVGLPADAWNSTNPALVASHDPASFDAVGKIALGDIDISEDGETLWAVNLNDRTLVEIPIGLDATAPAASEIIIHDVSSSSPACSNGTFRPFATAVRDGLVYVGGVCTGENGGTVDDVVAHILTHDPAGADGNFALHYSLPMNYRTTPARAGNECAVDLTDIGGTFTGCSWEAWRADWFSPSAPEGPNGPNLYVAPQPMLTDIEIDADGSLVLGFADRFGLQSGFDNYSTNTSDTNTYMGASAGDLIRICNVDGTLTFPCRPDGTEFYSGDNAPDPSFVPFNVHPESAWGGTAMLFSAGEVAISMADPLNVWSGGIGWMDKSTGLISESPVGVRRYELFAGYDQDDPANPSITGIGKATGLGDLELVCGAAPIEVGDRVWFDRNGNGLQDPSEQALPGVSVRLLDENGAEIGASVTDENGIYGFNSLIIPELVPNADFTIVFDESTADVSGISGLADASILTPTVQTAAGATTGHDSNIDSNRELTFTTGSAGTNDFSLDAGFLGGLQLGNLVWFDLNNNGDADDGEPVISGLTLNLFREDGAAGFDGTEELIDTQVTDEHGFYSFRELIDGDTYYVAVPTDQGTSIVQIDGQTLDALTLISSQGAATNPVDNNDDGDPITNFLAVTDGVVVSDAPNSEPIDETDTPPDPDTDSEAELFENTDHLIEDDDSNLTVDLGFIQNNRIGNLVWLDGRSGEPGFNNGIADPAESDLGLGGVTIELHSSANGVLTFEETTTTDANGNYWFSNQAAGTYVVAIPEGQTGQTLEGESVDIDELFVSSPDASAADDGIDDVNDGSLDAANGFASVSEPFDVEFFLSPADEAGDFGDTTEDRAETAANTATSFVVDQFSNLTLDFSFVERPTFAVGNLVWVDVDDDGIAEDGEPGIENVTVELWVDGGTAPIDTVVTDENGNYEFDELDPDDYQIVIPEGQTGQLVEGNPVDLSDLLISSTTSIDPNDDADNDNNGADEDPAFEPGDVVSNVISLGDPNPFEPTEPTNETVRSDDTTDEDTSGLDLTSNLTVDIGFVMPLRVGNIVWLDDGGGQPGNATYNEADENDGQADATEQGIPGVLVQLLDDDGDVVAETVTNAEGRYVFDQLLAGQFTVAIPADQAPMLDLSLTPDPTALDDLRSSSGVSANPEIADDDDDGEPATGFLSISDEVDLNYGAEATDEQGNFNSTTGDEAEADVNTDFPWLPDANSNLEIDFGFAPVPTFTIGNLLWEDFDNDGIADAGEPGIAGVLVQLLDDDGDVIAEVVTNADGHYRFDDLLEDTYSVQVPGDQTPDLGPVAGIDSDALTGLEISTTVVSTPDTPTSIDNDHNGVDSNGATTGGDAVSGPISVGEGDTHSEPTGETLRSDDATSDEVNTDRADRTDLTVDFGFWRGLRIGNQVWLDGEQGEVGYNNGIMDAGEQGIAGVSVELWIDLDDDGIAEPGGDDGTTAVDIMTTDAEGNYWFTHLDENTGYFLVVPSVPDGFSSVGQSADPVSTDNDDDGSPGFGNSAMSRVVSLTAAVSTTGETDANPSEDAEGEADSQLGEAFDDANSELTIDFGFIEVPLYRLGNLVWNDIDADGLASSDEAPIAGVLVQLTDASGTVIAETATDEFGNYVFENLLGGEYAVVIAESQTPTLGPVDGVVEGALDGFVSSTNENANADNDVDNDENGVLDDDVWRSGNVTLGPDPIDPPFDSEPTNEVNPFTGQDDDPDLGEAGSFPDGLSNLSVDFGFYRLEIGNQIWSDIDGNGLIDAGEPGIDGVVVELHSVDPDSGELTLVSTTTTESTTDGAGFYSFTGLEDGATYVVQVPASEFVEGGPLFGLFSSPDPNPVVDPNVGGAEDAGVDSDDNGIDPDDQGGAVATPPVTVSSGDEATGEDPDGDSVVADPNSNLTIDLGFTGLAVGNTVWFDENENGVIDGAEAGIAGVVLELWEVDENGEPVDESPIATTTTDEDGNYLFGSLTPGEFEIVLVAENFVDGGPLDAMTSTAGNGIVAPDVDDVDTDADDNGNLDPDGSTISTEPFTLEFATSPTGEPGDPSTIADQNSNLTVDFGLVPTPPLSLGNQIWADEDNSGTFDASEVGLVGVVVELWPVDENGEVIGEEPVQTVTTQEDGSYLFTGIDPGEFIVIVPAENFEEGQPLEGMFSSSTSEQSDVDLDDQGVDPDTVGGDVVSEPVLLLPFLEPVGELVGVDGHGTDDGEPIADENSNLTVDFGFFSLSLGNRVFFDEDNSGTLDDGEVGAPGVTLTLLATDGTVVSTTTTDADGYYLFAGLSEGDYQVSIDASNFEADSPLDGYFSSTGNGVAPDPEGVTLDSDDNGDPVDGAGSAVVSAPVTLVVNSEPVAGAETDLNTDQLIPVDANSNITVDFGFYTADLVSTLWLDEDNDGVVDGGETPLAGVIVELLDTDGNVIATTVTDENGTVLFTGLEEGTYVLNVVEENFEPGESLEGLGSTTGLNGIDDGVDPDVGSLAVMSLPITITASDTPPVSVLGSVVDAGLGFTPTSSVGDFVWDDTDGDGIQDPGEPGLASLSVSLFAVDPDSGQVESVPTIEVLSNSAGGYELSGVLPDEYVLEFDIPAGMEASPASQGSDASVDSNIDATGRTPIIANVLGRSVTNVDAGLSEIGTFADPPGALAFSGSDVLVLVLMALTLIVAGMWIVMTTYRRRRIS